MVMADENDDAYEGEALSKGGSSVRHTIHVGSGERAE